MTVAADLHKAIVSLWSTSELDSRFKAYWSEADKALYLSLSDTEATPGTPFPYCVYSQGTTNVVDRMTATDNSNRMILDVPWTFRVFATAQASKTGKQIAADLIALIMTVFDGDVTTSRKPAELTLDNGSFLETQYQNDYGAQASDGFYAWTVSYTFRLDFPFAT